MNRVASRVLACASIVGLATGCKRKPTPAAPPEPVVPPVGSAPPSPPPLRTPVDTSPLWAFAPAGTTYAAVIGPGVIPRVQALGLALVHELEGQPWARPLLAQIARIRGEGPVDLLDAASFTKAGWDVAPGYAIFTGEAGSVLVFTMADRAAWRALRKGAVVQVGGRELDQFTNSVCVQAARYVCGPTLAMVDEALAPHEAPIAAAVKALPAEARGDAEFYVDLARTRSFGPTLAPVSEVLGTLAAGGLAVRVDPDGATVHAWARGAMTPALVAMLPARPPQPELAALTGGAASVARFTVTPALLAWLGAPLAVLEHLTGDLQLVTAGTGALGGALLAKVADGTQAVDVAAALCKQLQAEPRDEVQNLALNATGCTATLSVGAAMREAVHFDLPFTPVAVVARGGVVALTLGDVDLAALAGDATADAASAEARAALTGPVAGALWSRGLDVDRRKLPGSMRDAVRSTTTSALIHDTLGFLGGKVYELSLAARLSSDTAAVTVRMTTFASDTGPLQDRRARLAQASPTVGPLLGMVTALAIKVGRDADPDQAHDSDHASDDLPPLGDGPPELKELPLPADPAPVSP